MDKVMGLKEYCDKLPIYHLVNTQLHELQVLVRKPHLDYATTGELLAELIARARIDGSINHQTKDIVKSQVRQRQAIELERKTAQRLDKLETESDGSGE